VKLKGYNLDYMRETRWPPQSAIGPPAGQPGYRLATMTARDWGLGLASMRPKGFRWVNSWLRATHLGLPKDYMRETGTASS